MKTYIDIVLKREKKPVPFEKICEKVEGLIRSENPDYSLSPEDKEEIQRALKEQVGKYHYYRTPNGFYTLLSKTSFRKGRYHGNRAGEGFIISTVSYTNKEGEFVVKEEKYTVSRDNNGGAIDGDYVLVDIGGNGNKPKITTIIDRTLGTITGEITRIGNAFFVKPLDKKKQSLTIALEGEHIEGEIVSVALMEARDNNFYIGEIVDVFRHKDDPHERARLEAFSCGMPEGFSEESYRQLETIPMVVRPEDKVGRYDFTDWEIFSIDGSNTKDKDDCISFMVLPNGNYLISDHIADSPAYVPTGSPIHKDAFRKGTSYYFGGCVEPQLPRKLSNGICSLLDGQERLCKSILMEYTPDGRLVSRSLVRSVIKSRIGMAYEKVNQILQTGVVDKEYLEYEATLKKMSSFAKTLHKIRVSRGAIEFERPEIYFVYDAEGRAIGTKVRNQEDAENLIEEFMIIGNVNVFEYLTERGIPCPYRIHQGPNRERLSDYLKFLDAIGIPFEHEAAEICKYKTLLQELTEHIKNTGHLHTMLVTDLLRCLSHAAYSPVNVGHYGAGLDTYGHFTSPDRRLGDDTVSRIIDDCVFEPDEKKRLAAIERWKTDLPMYCVQATKMERVEELVERKVQLLDTAVYLEPHKGEEFEGTIIFIGSGGLTIQLDDLLLGKVRSSTLPGDYVYNPDSYTFASKNGHAHYYIGDRLKLRLLSANPDTKSVEFEVLEKLIESPVHKKNASGAYVKTIR